MVNKNSSNAADDEGRKLRWHDRLLVIPLVITGTALFLLSFLATNRADLVGIAHTPFHDGYWQLYEDGKIEFFGEASEDPLRGDKLGAENFVAIASAAPEGFYAVTGNGAVYVYAGANYYGGIDGSTPKSPIVDIIVLPRGVGYRLVSADGSIYDFNVKQIPKGTPKSNGININTDESPIVKAWSTRSGDGYWLVDKQGKVYAFGDAQYFGDASNQNLKDDNEVIGIWGSITDEGYTIVDEQGGKYEFPQGASPRCFGGVGEEKANKPYIQFLPDMAGHTCYFVDKQGDISKYSIKF